MRIAYITPSTKEFSIKFKFIKFTIEPSDTYNGNFYLSENLCGLKKLKLIHQLEIDWTLFLKLIKWILASENNSGSNSYHH